MNGEGKNEWWRKKLWIVRDVREGRVCVEERRGNRNRGSLTSSNAFEQHHVRRQAAASKVRHRSYYDDDTNCGVVLCAVCWLLMQLLQLQ
jgi:hypothetical protein